MDPSAPQNVLKGVAITSAASTLLASVYAILKQQPIWPVVKSAARRSGVAGATFFSLREYVISPSLIALGDNNPQYVRRRREIAAKWDPEQHYSHQLSWEEMRTHKLSDSLLSGTVAGAVLSRMQKADARGVIRGAGNMGMLCTLLQLLYNESGVIRVKYVSRKLEDATHAQSPVQTTPSSSGKVYIPPPEEPSRPFSERFFEYIGLAKVSDEDFVQRLKVKRDACLRRIAEIEAEREKERGKNTPTRPESAGSP